MAGIFCETVMSRVISSGCKSSVGNQKYFFATGVSLCGRSKATIEEAREKATKKVRQLDSVAESLAAKGFLRSIKAYNPPENVPEKIKSICAAQKLPSDDDYSLIDLKEKFQFLKDCFKDFQHGVPNSQLHDIKTIGDVISFYETPVDTVLPLDAMKNIQLPENLHIQHEYVRFHPETDTMFGGKTAFPKSSTLVTGLKYRGKYKGHEAKRSWP